MSCTVVISYFSKIEIKISTWDMFPTDSNIYFTLFCLVSKYYKLFKKLKKKFLQNKDNTKVSKRG